MRVGLKGATRTRAFGNQQASTTTYFPSTNACRSDLLLSRELLPRLALKLVLTTPNFLGKRDEMYGTSYIVPNVALVEPPFAPPNVDSMSSPSTSYALGSTIMSAYRPFPQGMLLCKPRYISLRNATPGKKTKPKLSIWRMHHQPTSSSNPHRVLCALASKHSFARNENRSSKHRHYFWPCPIARRCT